MTLAEIKDALRHLPAEQRRELLMEFLPEVLTSLSDHEKQTLDVAAGVIEGREELLRRLARR